jgi:proton-translocating NADH-quinone oxidoreductase chain L
MISLILFLSFLSFLVCSVIGGIKWQSEKGLQFYIIIIWTSIWILVVSLFISIGNTEFIYQIHITEWFNIFPFYLQWGLELNKVTLTMLLLIITISFFVHLFSLNYMGGEPHLSRFMGYLGLFTFFMLILVTAPNLIQLFIGWEGVGVCSYLLINFWSTRLLAAQSAYKAMAVNKVGDMAILIAIGILIKEIGTININVMNCSNYFNNNNLIMLSSLFLLIGVVGKSAQLGLHMWLPDAMEGPTPVSALIHAATMVTAGVFLIIKLSPLFIMNENIKFLIMLMGSLTCIVAAIIGATQSDLKKIIAYSTCSQLGYMTLVGGYGFYSVSLFHLFNHGIFKALLFLSAGLVIHTLFNEQNLLKMGLKTISPLGKSGFIIGNLAIIGFPFLTGYYSKDIFLELIAASNFYIYPLWLGYIAASLTCFYSLKLLHISYNKERRFSPIFTFHYHTNSNFILIPLLILSIGSIILGFLLFKTLNLPIKPIMVSNLLKQIPLLILFTIIILFIFGLIHSKALLLNKNLLQKIIKMFINSFYFNEIISKLNNSASIPSFTYTYKLIDSQILEWNITSNITKYMKKITSNTSIYNTLNLSNIIRSLVFILLLLIIIII